MAKTTNKEIDRLVAELLGWKYNKSSFEQYEPSCWRDAHGNKVWGAEFRPSTDIAAAWVLIHGYHPNGSVSFSLNRFHSQDGRWECDYAGSTASADTAPQAICAAALKCAGIDVTPYDWHEQQPDG